MSDAALVGGGIGVLAVGVAAAWLWLLAARTLEVVVTVFWLAATLGLASAGVFSRFTPPPPLLFAVGIATLTVIRVGLRADPRGAPLLALVALQGFRLPLELTMHRAATAGIMPMHMSFSRWNFDVVSGVGAVVLAALLYAGRAPRAVLLAWNALGAALLLNIIVIAVLSTPTFAAFGSAPERLNTWIAVPPYVWLPTVLVPAALLGHILIARRLALDGRASRAPGTPHAA